MNYSQIIEMDNVTVGDCLDGYKFLNRRAIINDGHIINFIDEKEEGEK